MDSQPQPTNPETPGESNSSTPIQQPTTQSQPSGQPPMQSQPATQPNPVNNNGPNQNLTVNQTSAVSKVGVYARIAFFDLWLLVFATCIALNIIVGSASSRSVAIVFLIAELIITIPTFVIANKKREKELSQNPSLIEDIFLKKYIRKNLFIAVFLTIISAFILIFEILLKLFVSSASHSITVKGILDELIFTIGFGLVLAFYWKQHKRTVR
ncbi:MAG TPA: hypothetical protein VMR34_04080 [Candidatus Saccharimonadales bacterium]|nr:hypothetical protein [Candidatus Saccharimonadales bacterium]